jgi:hypothetical protein
MGENGRGEARTGLCSKRSRARNRLKRAARLRPCPNRCPRSRAFDSPLRGCHRSRRLRGKEYDGNGCGSWVRLAAVPVLVPWRFADGMKVLRGVGAGPLKQARGDAPGILPRAPAVLLMCLLGRRNKRRVGRRVGKCCRSCLRCLERSSSCFVAPLPLLSPAHVQAIAQSSLLNHPPLSAAGQHGLEI